jgi:aquaporin NIP
MEICLYNPEVTELSKKCEDFAAAAALQQDKKATKACRTMADKWTNRFLTASRAGLILRPMKKWMAEFLGTFALVFAGTGAIVINNASNGVITHAGIALTFGLVVMAMIYTVGDVSGAHLNPAVSIGFAVARRFGWRELPGYIAAQLAGAFAASGLLALLFPADKSLGVTLPAGPALQSFILETVLTFLLMLVILSVSTGAKEKGITAGIAIGAVIALEAMFAGPICGASMNPARSIAPAVVGGHLQFLWIYIAGPILGATVAVPACCAFREPGCCWELKIKN